MESSPGAGTFNHKKFASGDAVLAMSVKYEREIDDVENVHV